MKVVSIVGARPEFVQAAPVSRALRGVGIIDVLVHTGQHYDYRMSQAFFDDLGIPAPKYNLEVGSGGHAAQTAEILTRLEPILKDEQPDCVIVRGDTNSTVAGALAASKLHLPFAHIEAGERSYDRRMPEEINRVVVDSISDVYFCASATAALQLAAEGHAAHVHVVGDVMFDAVLRNLEVTRQRSVILTDLGLTPGTYVLTTVHRAATTDDPERLGAIVTAFNAAAEPVIFPAHPRTRAALERIGARFAAHVRVIDPVGYFDMLQLEANARLIATDSGGVQREAYFLKRPCLTLREETEWTETVSAGWNQLVGVDPERILRAWRTFAPQGPQPAIFGDGRAAERIAAILSETPPLFGQCASRTKAH